MGTPNLKIVMKNWKTGDTSELTVSRETYLNPNSENHQRFLEAYEARNTAGYRLFEVEEPSFELPMISLPGGATIGGPANPISAKGVRTAGTFGVQLPAEAAGGAAGGLLGGVPGAMAGAGIAGGGTQALLNKGYEKLGILPDPTGPLEAGFMAGAGEGLAPGVAKLTKAGGRGLLGMGSRTPQSVLDRRLAAFDEFGVPNPSGPQVGGRQGVLSTTMHQLGVDFPAPIGMGARRQLETGLEATGKSLEDLLGTQSRGEIGEDVIGALTDGRPAWKQRLAPHFEEVFRYADQAGYGKAEIDDVLNTLTTQGSVVNAAVRNAMSGGTRTGKILKGIVEQYGTLVPGKPGVYSFQKVPLRQLQDLRSALGSLMPRVPREDIPVFQEELKSIYRSISDAMEGAMEKADPAIKTQFQKTNKIWSDNMRRDINFTAKYKNLADPADVANKLDTAMSKGRTKELETMKARVIDSGPEGEELWRNVAREQLRRHSIGVETASSEAIDGALNPQALRSWLAGMDEPTKKLMFGEMYRDVENAVIVSSSFWPGARPVGPTLTSQMLRAPITGTMKGGRALGIGAAATGAAANPMAALAAIPLLAMTPGAYSRLITFQPFVRWFSKGLKLKPTDMAYHLGLLGTSMMDNANDEDKDALRAYMVELEKAMKANPAAGRSGLNMPVNAPNDPRQSQLGGAPPVGVLGR